MHMLKCNMCPIINHKKMQWAISNHVLIACKTMHEHRLIPNMANKDKKKKNMYYIS